MKGSKPDPLGADNSVGAAPGSVVRKPVLKIDHSTRLSEAGASIWEMSLKGTQAPVSAGHKPNRRFGTASGN